MGKRQEIEPQTDFGRRLRLAISHAFEKEGLTQTDIAAAAGMARSTLNEAITKGKGSAKTVKLASVCGVSATWLATGEGAMLQNVTTADVALGRVPLISSVAAGMFTEVSDINPAGFADEWIHCSVPVKAHTFALKVDGDSMEPDYPAGKILIVEPEMEARPGDLVIAKNTENEATFKKLVRDSGEYYLMPLNSRYPMKPLGDAKIIGVVRQVIENLR